MSRIVATANGLLVDGVPMRTCKKCGNAKSLVRFESFGRSGKSWRRGTCYDCRGQYSQDNFERLAEYRRNYNAANRSNKRQKDFDRRAEIKAYVDELKRKPCADCGQCFPPVCMDFDHVGPKQREVGKMVSAAYKLPLIIEEIKKCELVCANCHRVRTSIRRDNLTPPRRKETPVASLVPPTCKTRAVSVAPQCDFWADTLIAGSLT